MAKTFKAGDRFKLISGGVTITVKGPQNGPFAALVLATDIECKWFQKDVLKTSTFDPDSLDFVE